MPYRIGKTLPLSPPLSFLFCFGVELLLMYLPGFYGKLTCSTEVSPNNRAGCKNKECKDESIKITKGEIRVGTWIETDNFQSWSWRHWGCTTPLILSHIVKGVFEEDKLTGDENFELIDGWEDLPEVYQDTVREALIQGHVNDDAWKGDPECNRPGMRGFRIPSKKAAAAKKADVEDAGEEAKDEPKKDSAATGENDKDVKPAKEVKKASRAKTKKLADDEKVDEADEADNEAEEKPAKAKRSARAKKTAANESANKETTESTTKANAKAKRAPRAKAAAKEDAVAETQPAKRRGRPPKSATATEESTKPAPKGTKRKVSDDLDQSETANKPKRGRKKAAVAEKETEERAATPEKPKRGRKKAAKE
ncbi:uncharacterized protein N7458_010578 [Penicillium daleae]|uniref:PARP-type domain-containing protein n=1 Tax=Penicillium daleae TaxID=63821 RepID=A0AAD6BZN4_9EURO|nr:uncharacterized protein N7458_010578 [Penicillium daleae]KAJ5439580.1 hypothetical protein N7458_010578 [Penicillium daleae]